MENKKIKSVVDEAVRILRDYPELKYSEAIKMAKDILADEKEPTRSPAK